MTPARFLMGTVFLVSVYDKGGTVEVYTIENRGYYYIIGERAKRARHSQEVCSIENRGYM